MYLVISYPVDGILLWKTKQTKASVLLKQGKSVPPHQKNVFLNQKPLKSLEFQTRVQIKGNLSAPQTSINITDIGTKASGPDYAWAHLHRNISVEDISTLLKQQ